MSTGFVPPMLNFGDDSLKGDPAYPVAGIFRKPNVPIGAGRDEDRARVGGDAGAELGDHTKRRNPAYPVLSFRKPEVAIRAGRNAVNVRVGADAGAELGDDAKRGNPANPALELFREPQVAIRARRDAIEQRGGADAGAELRDDAERGNPTDPAAEISVNHRLPSGPAVILKGRAPALMPALNSVTTPSGVILPIRSLSSVNHRLPSGPAAMNSGPKPAVLPMLNSVMTCSHAPPDSKQNDANMQPRRMRQR
jgi:hypothetical protein